MKQSQKESRERKELQLKVSYTLSLSDGKTYAEVERDLVVAFPFSVSLYSALIGLSDSSLVSDDEVVMIGTWLKVAIQKTFIVRNDRNFYWHEGRCWDVDRIDTISFAPAGVR